jgi:DNA-binding NarL/FixJ family response regulator
MPGIDGYEVLRQLRAERATAATPFIFVTAKGERHDLRAGMNLGADDYLIKPVARGELLAAIAARFERIQQQQTELKPVFDSPEPLQRKLGLTPKQAEVLFWVAQGKTNAEIGLILECSPATVKKHLEHVFEKMGAENRSAAAFQALEALSQA